MGVIEVEESGGICRRGSAWYVVITVGFEVASSFVVLIQCVVAVWCTSSRMWFVHIATERVQFVTLQIVCRTRETV